MGAVREKNVTQCRAQSDNECAGGVNCVELSVWSVCSFVKSNHGVCKCAWVGLRMCI